MKDQQIKDTLAEIESWMMMTCEGCAMPEKLNPLIDKIRRLFDEDNGGQKKTIAADMGVKICGDTGRGSKKPGCCSPEKNS